MSDVDYQFIDNDTIKVSSTGIRQDSVYREDIKKKADDVCVKDFGNTYRAIGYSMLDNDTSGGVGSMLMPVYCVPKTIIDDIKKMGSHYKPNSKTSSTFRYLPNHGWKGPAAANSLGPWWLPNGEILTANVTNHVGEGRYINNSSKGTSPNQYHLNIDLGKCESDFGPGWFNVSQRVTDSRYTYEVIEGSTYGGNAIFYNAQCRNFVKEYNDAIARINEEIRLHELEQVALEYAQKLSDLEDKHRADIKDLNDKHTTTVNKLKADHAKAITDLQADHDRDMLKLEAERDRLEEDLADVEEQRDQLEQDKIDLNKKLVKQAKLKDEIDAEMKHLEERAEQNQELIDDLNAKIDENEAEITRLTNEHLTELADLNATHQATVDSLEAQITGVEDRIADLTAAWEKDRQELIDQYDNMVIEYEGIIASREEELADALQNMQDTIQRISDDLDAYKHAKEEEKEQIMATMREDIDTFLINAENDRDEALARFDREKAQRKSDHDAELTKMQEEHDQRMTTQQALNDEVLADLRETEQTMKDTISDYNDIVTTYNNNITNYQAQYQQEIQELNDDHNAKIAAAQADLDEALARLEDLKQEAQDNYNETIEGLLEHIRTTTNDLRNLQAEYDELKIDRDLVQAALEQRQQELEEADELLAQKRKEAEELLDRKRREAEVEAQSILDEANAEAQRILDDAEEAPLSIIREANIEAREIREQAEKDARDILEAAGLSGTIDKDGKLVTTGKRATGHEAWSTNNILGVAGAGVAGIAVGVAAAMLL